MQAHVDDLFAQKLPDQFPKLTNLYEKAKKDFWNETSAIDWDRPLTLSTAHRECLAQVLSIIYYGERAALTISAQLVVTVPDEEARQALACQVIEEAKHVSAFRRLIEKLDVIAPPSFFAKRLLTDIIATDEPAAKIAGMHLFVENIANHTFNTLRTALDDELVCEVLDYVARDEKKHTAIAVLYLPALLERLSPAKVSWMQYKQMKWLALGLGMVKDAYPYARTLGVDLAQAGQRALRDHYRLRAQLTSTRGLIDIPGFERVIDLVGGWATPPKKK